MIILKAHFIYFLGGDWFLLPSNKGFEFRETSIGISLPHHTPPPTIDYSDSLSNDQISWIKNQKWAFWLMFIFLSSNIPSVLVQYKLMMQTSGKSKLYGHSAVSPNTHKRTSLPSLFLNTKSILFSRIQPCNPNIYVLNLSPRHLHLSLSISLFLSMCTMHIPIASTN